MCSPHLNLSFGVYLGINTKLTPFPAKNHLRFLRKAYHDVILESLALT